MDDTTSKISIIVPAYNVETEIKRCVNSLSGQTYPNIEIIVVDDGSVDNTANVLEQLSQEDDRIVVIHQENKGAALARETGIRISTGDFLMFCDSDDYYEENACEVLLTALTQNDADVAAGSYIKHENEQIRQYGSIGDPIKLDRTEAIECLLFGRYFTGSLCAKIYRKSLFVDLDIPVQVRFNEDILMLYFLLKKTCGLIVVSTAVYHYVVRPQSSCGQMNNQMRMKDVLTVSEVIFQDAIGAPFAHAARERHVRFLLNDYRNACARQDGERAKVRRKKILNLVPDCKLIHARGLRYNIYMLRYIPNLYQIVYAIYDRIRVPNWDL